MRLEANARELENHAIKRERENDSRQVDSKPAGGPSDAVRLKFLAAQSPRARTAAFALTEGGGGGEEGREQMLSKREAEAAEARAHKRLVESEIGQLGEFGVVHTHTVTHTHTHTHTPSLAWYTHTP